MDSGLGHIVDLVAQTFDAFELGWRAYTCAAIGFALVIAIVLLLQLTPWVCALAAAAFFGPITLGVVWDMGYRR